MPFMIPFIPVILQATGAAVAAIGLIKEGQASKAASQANAAAARRNAAIAEVNAHKEASAKRRENALRMGAMRARAGASGVKQTSALDLLQDVGTQGEMDVKDTLLAGQFAASGYRMEADAERRAGRAASTSGYLSAAGALAGGLGQAASTPQGERL